MKKLLVMVCMFSLFFIPMAFAYEGYGDGSSNRVDASTISGATGIGNGEVNVNGVPIPRPLPYPVNVPFVGTPNEFLNESSDGNYVTILNMFPSGTVFTKAELVAMLSPVDARWYNTKGLFPGIDGNFHSWGGIQDIKNVPDSAAVTFIYVIPQSNVPTPVQSKPIGSDSARVTNGIADSWSLIARIGLNALTIPKCNTVLLTSEGKQKFTKVSAMGIALGFSYAKITEDGRGADGGTGTLGIGYTSGKAGRLANPWIQASFLIKQ